VCVISLSSENDRPHVGPCSARVAPPDRAAKLREGEGASPISEEMLQFFTPLVRQSALQHAALPVRVRGHQRSDARRASRGSSAARSRHTRATCSRAASSAVPALVEDGSSNSLHWRRAAPQARNKKFPANGAAPAERGQTEWTRLRPIRTVGEVELEFAVYTREALGFQRIAGEAGRLRRLG
jgi:hypothetical protein